MSRYWESSTFGQSYSKAQAACIMHAKHLLPSTVCLLPLHLSYHLPDLGGSGHMTTSVGLDPYHGSDHLVCLVCLRTTTSSPHISRHRVVCLDGEWLTVSTTGMCIAPAGALHAMHCVAVGYATY